MQTNLYFKRFHYHIILSIFNAMMESFVAFAKIYIYILYVKPRNTFMFFFFEIVKNLVASEKYLENCETLIINLYIVWKSQMYCPSGLTMQDLFFVNRQYTHSAKLIITPIKTRHRLPECILQHPGLTIMRRRRNIVP